jgi:YesN/AraC family two-component response regulator
VVKSIRFIRNHLYSPCRVNEVATAVGLNTNYLSSLFKSEVGVDMSRYIREQKLTEAKDLLFQSAYSVTEIAEMLGFCDAAYFSNQYKKMFGLSPKNSLRSGRQNMAVYSPPEPISLIPEEPIFL